MSHWVLPQLGTPILVTAVQRATNLEKQTNEIKKRMDDFQSSVQSRWDVRTSTAKSPSTDEQNILPLENEDEEFAEGFNGVIKSEDLADEPVKLGPDDWLNIEAGVDLEEHGFRQGKVKKRAVDADGAPTGTANDNVSLDGWAREVEFSDGWTEISTANIIAENLLAEVDAEGNGFLLMGEIEDHQKTADATPRHKGTF